MGQPLKRTIGYLSCHRVSYLALVPVELIPLFRDKTVWKCEKVCQGLNKMAHSKPCNSAVAKVFNCTWDTFVCSSAKGPCCIWRVLISRMTSCSLNVDNEFLKGHEVSFLNPFLKISFGLCFLCRTGEYRWGFVLAASLFVCPLVSIRFYQIRTGIT